MKRKNMTRSALITSIISLLLCVSMLVGTTFAWFTDSVESGRNTIAAGNLDVELYHSDKDNSGYVTAETELFNDVTLWEPGVVVYENFKVENVGSLALKYQLSINFENETKVNGHGLSEALDVAVVVGGVKGTREQVIASAAEWTDLQSFTLSGVLEGETTSETYGIVIYWQPTEDDNLFNMNNDLKGNTLSIDLGVNLFATQEMYEEDSFGEDYDGAAAWVALADTDWYFDDPEATEFTISSAEELAGLAALVNGTATAPVVTYAADGATTVQDSFAGQTIKLGGNIDLAGHEWTSIGNWTYTFDGVFDGQNHTISNLYINDAAGEGIGLFGVTVKAEINNVTLENVNITGYSMVAGLVGAAYPANISNCHITGDVKIVAEYAYVAGIAGYCYYGTQVENCSVIANETGLIQSVTRNAVGGITAWQLEGNHKVVNCQVKNLDLIGWTNVGGITGFVHYNNTIEGCSVENVNLVKTRVDGNPGIGLIAGGWSYSATNAITLRNNTVNTATLSGNHIAYTAYNELYGSEYGGKTSTNFVLENNTTTNITNNLVEVVVGTANNLAEALQNDAIVVLKSGTYTLPTLAGKEGITIIGAADGSTVIGGEDATTGFSSNFGKDTTIQNVTFSGSTNGVRWSYAQGGTITFDNCTFAGDSTYGFHMDSSKGATLIFNNCTFSGFNAFASDLERVEFNSCTFLHNGSYGHTNIWSNGYFNDCTWGDKTSVSTRGDNGHLYFNGVEESYHHEYIG